MKKLLFFGVILLVSNSIFIFFFGLAQEIKANNFHRSVQDALAVESAVILALHAYEDTGRPDSTGGNVTLYGRTLDYSLRNMNDDYMYLSIKCKTGKKTLAREYLLKK